jgi:hypothetical protein
MERVQTLRRSQLPSFCEAKKTWAITDAEKRQAQQNQSKPNYLDSPDHLQFVKNYLKAAPTCLKDTY